MALSPLDLLQRQLGYRFKDISLLELALSHRSLGSSNNERLEFLGDSILNHLVAEDLYHRCPDAREGELSRMRAMVVKGDTLAAVARELSLGEYLRLGPGERKGGGRQRKSILADALEAIAGALLLDGGVDACRDVLVRVLEPRLVHVTAAGLNKDAKTRLQEYLQSRGLPLPEYELVKTSGSDHEQEFHVVCRFAHSTLTSEGRGSSRRRAEQAAAAVALEALSDA